MSPLRRALGLFLTLATTSAWSAAGGALLARFQVPAKASFTAGQPAIDSVVPAAEVTRAKADAGQRADAESFESVLNDIRFLQTLPPRSTTAVTFDDRAAAELGARVARVCDALQVVDAVVCDRALALYVAKRMDPNARPEEIAARLSAARQARADGLASLEAARRRMQAVLSGRFRPAVDDLGSVTPAGTTTGRVLDPGAVVTTSARPRPRIVSDVPEVTFAGVLRDSAQEREARIRAYGNDGTVSGGIGLATDHVLQTAERFLAWATDSETRTRIADGVRWVATNPGDALNPVNLAGATWAAGHHVVGQTVESWKQVKTDAGEFQQNPTMYAALSVGWSGFNAATDVVTLGAKGAVKTAVTTAVRAAEKDAVKVAAKQTVAEAVVETAQRTVPVPTAQVNAVANDVAGQLVVTPGGASARDQIAEALRKKGYEPTPEVQLAILRRYKELQAEAAARATGSFLQSDAQVAARFGGVNPLELKGRQIHGGIAGETTIIEINGETWYRKKISPNLGNSVDAELRALSPGARAHNEIGGRAIVQRYLPSFGVSPEAVAVRSGDDFYLLSRDARAKPNDAAYRSMKPVEMADFSIAKLVFRIEDMHHNNVLFGAGRPVMIDMEKIIPAPLNLDLSRPFTRQAVNNDLVLKNYPIVSRTSANDLKVYQDRIAALRRDFNEGEFRQTLTNSGFSAAEADAYLAAVRTNMANYEANIQVYINEAARMQEAARQLRLASR